MAELVTLDGFPLSGVTREGRWTVQTPLDGWFNRPSPKTNNDERVNGDGKLRGEVEYSSRQITINGMVRSDSHEYLHQAAERINALGFRGDVQLVVAGHGATQSATVDPRNGAEIQAEFLSDTVLRFQIPLEALDPFKYGESRSFSTAVGSSVDVFHRGTVPAWPVATVTGSLPSGYSLSLGGRTVTVTKSLATGSTHTVDMRTGILRQNGSRVYGSLGVAKYFTVKPGSRQSFSSSTSTGSGTVTLRFDDTYI